MLTSKRKIVRSAAALCLLKTLHRFLTQGTFLTRVGSMAVIPLMMQEQYNVKGWLGMILL